MPHRDIQESVDHEREDPACASELTPYAAEPPLRPHPPLDPACDAAAVRPRLRFRDPRMEPRSGSRADPRLSEEALTRIITLTDRLRGGASPGPLVWAPSMRRSD